MRAIATEAGVALGVVHYCFQDKNDLLEAMALEITRQNSSQVLMEMPVHGDVTVLIPQAVKLLWSAVSANPGAQLLSYELTTYSIRHPELRDVAVNQTGAGHEAARAFLLALAVSGDIEWTVPLETLSRIVTTTVDGVLIAWLADKNDEAARLQLNMFGEWLSAQARSR
jgi:AcrR family transcriptional regulator